MATVRSVTVSLNTMDRSFGRGFRNAARDVRKFQRTTDTSMSKVRASVLKAGASLKGLTKGFTVGVKTAAAVGALSALAGAAAASAQSMIALTAAIAPVSGLLAALPGAIVTAVVALGVLKLAFIGVSAAMKAAYKQDTKAFDKALKQLTPSARAFAKEFKATVPALKEFQRAAQTGFFSQLNGSLSRFVKLLKETQPFIFGLAKEMGQLARQLLVFATAERTVSQLNNILMVTRSSLHEMRSALNPILTGFLDLAVVGAGFLNSLTPALADATRRFGEFMSAAANSGRALEWMQTGLDVLKQLGRILGNVGSIFSSVFKAASETGGGLLGTIESLTGKFAAFLKSAEGVKTLRAIFSGIGEIGKALGPVIIALGKGLGAIAPSIGRIAQIVGPVLTKAINALAPALTKLEPGITALIVGLGGAFEAIAPALPAVAQALSDIAIALAPVLPALGYLVAQLAGGLAAAISQLVSSGALPQLVTAVIQFGLALGGGLMDALIAITPYLPDLVMSLAELLITLTPLIPEMTKAAVALAPLIPTLTDMITLITQLTSDVMPGFIFFIQSQIAVTKDLVTVVKDGWFMISDAIRFYVDKANKVIDGLAKLAGKFGGWFKGAKDSAVKKLGELVDWCKGLGTRIKNGLGDLGGLLYRAGQNVLQGLINGIVSKFNSLINTARSAADIIRRVFPFSPAKDGPLKTHPMDQAGLNIASMLAGGMTQGQQMVARAAVGLAGAAVLSPGQPGLAVAGPGLPQPRGALRTGDRQPQPGVDYQRLAAAVTSALKAAGVGATYLDGKAIADNTSRHQGRATQQRRRTG